MEKKQYIKLGKITKRYSYNGEFILSLNNLNSNYFDIVEDILFLDIQNGDLLPIFPIEYTERNSTSLIVRFDKPYIDYNDDFYLNKIVYIKLDNNHKNKQKVKNLLFDPDYFLEWNIFDTTEKAKGTIINYFDSKAQIILIADFNGNEVYIPFHADLIEKIDEDVKTIIFNLPKGLLHINKSSED
ncbi:MAG: hypothetical protein ACOX4D_03490 [Bacteroidales bacterium]